MTRIKIAIQKKGRLADECYKIFEKCGVTFDFSKRQLFHSVKELPIDFLLVRDDDIPNFVSKNICDFGIIGLDVFQENKLSQNLNTDIYEKLGICKCRLSFASPNELNINNIKEINNLTIATTYPNIVNDFLKKNKINANIVKILGSVEITPSVKIADIIADLVSSGTTLKENNLKEFATILESEAVLIKNNNINNEKTEIINRFLTRFKSVVSVSKRKYIVLNCPENKVNDIIKIIPSAKSPSILKLANSNMVALHTLCNDDIFWDIMEELKKNGASDIAVLPVEKILD